MVKNWKEHVSLEEAWHVLRATCGSLKETSLLPIEEAVGYLLAQDVYSNRNVPHFSASAVDGFALSSQRTSGASLATPVYLDVKEYQWVNTGMPVSFLYDAVLMVEDSSKLENGKLAVYRVLSAGDNIRPVGEDVTKGQIVAREGDVISPAGTALFLAAGHAKVCVKRRPKTLFIPTGDEIISAKTWLNEGPSPGRVVESNSTLLRGYFSQWGFPLDVLPPLPDDEKVIRDSLLRGVKEYDLVLIGAGSAKGEKDHTVHILSEEGKILFHWLLMKPGRPASAALVHDIPVVNLPGFPMSAAVTLWSLVYPLLSLLETGDFDESQVLKKALCALKEERMELLLPVSSTPGRNEWLRLKAIELKGKKKVFPLSSGSSTMWAMSEADGFALLSRPAAECPVGSEITVWLTREVKWEKRLLFQGSNDPAFERIGSYVRQRGGELVFRFVGSLGGLAALARGECHLAACHLLDPETGQYNDSYIERLSQGKKWVRQLLFYREQGILIAKGNPLDIYSIEDLAIKKVRFVNRQPGAGTRVLLDVLLKQKKIFPQDINGYSIQSITHFDAANRIAAGVADAALGIKAAADALDLDFIPLAEEPYELVYPEEYEAHPCFKALQEAIHTPDWRSQVGQLGGYRWKEF